MNLPQNEEVKIIEGVQRVFHHPTIRKGETSSTGKTILLDRGENRKNYRLDTEKILDGETVFRDGLKFRLYTKEAMQGQQKANKQHGPVAGTDSVTSKESLPEPTHSVH